MSRDNSNIETIKSDLKLNILPSRTMSISVSSSNSGTPQRLFNEGTEYISTSEPRAFMSECTLNCSVSVDYL